MMRTLPIGLTDFLSGMGTRDWGTHVCCNQRIHLTDIDYLLLPQ